MLTVNVRSNYKKLSGSLDQEGCKQLSFAFAKTFNETMKAVEKYTVARTYPRALCVRNRGFFKAAMFNLKHSVRWATKTKLRVSARDRFERGNLQLHAAGGTKRARSGRIAIPSRFTKSTRGARGVRKAYVLEPLSIVRKVSSIGMDRVMRSINAMGRAASRSGCSTSCIGAQGYQNASAFTRMRNGSRGRYRPSCSGRISVKH